MLFSGDIAYNLNFGNESGSDADWKEAARIACADEFIVKKDGKYHAEIAQGRTNLSGSSAKDLLLQEL